MSLPSDLNSLTSFRLGAYLCLGGAFVLGVFAGHTPVGLVASIVLLIGSAVSGVVSVRSTRRQARRNRRGAP